MPFVYTVGLPANVASLTSCGTTNTEYAGLAMRQATRGFDLQAVYAHGMANAATSISGIGFRVRRWTTAGSGGTAITPAPKRIGTTASTTAASNSGGAITVGTVDGSTQVAFGCGGSGPGGWVAPDLDSRVHVEGGSSDELLVYTIATPTSMPFGVATEIVE